MSAENHLEHARRRAGRRLATPLRLLAAAAFLCVWAATPSFGQVTTYSDSWFVDYSGSTPAEAYDGAPEIESTVNSELGQNAVAATGVTEADYNSGSQSVQTTLTSPSGATATGTSYEYEWYTRSEVSLPYTVDPNRRGEENWQVTTGHYYWVDEPYRERCTDRVCPEEPVQQVSYGAAPRQYGYGRYYYFIPINIFVTISLSGQGFAGVVIQPPYGVRPYRCLYTRRTCYGSPCGSVYSGMMFHAYGNAICDEYLQVYFLRVRIGYRTSCIPVYGISLSVPGECF